MEGKAGSTRVSWGWGEEQGGARRRQVESGGANATRDGVKDHCLRAGSELTALTNTAP